MPATNVVPMPSVLEGHAKRIHRLMDAWKDNTIALGLELKAARDKFPMKGRNRPGWYQWLKDHAGMHHSRASVFIVVAEKFGGRKLPSTASHEILRLLSSKNTPVAAEQEVFERLEKGERISKRQTIKIVKEHKLPKPAEANRMAKETGQAVAASDGFIYFGASKEQAEEAENRRTIVYGVRHALETLAEIELTPINFIKFMLPHQRWDRDEEKVIAKARAWLDGLEEAWSEWGEK